MDRDVFKREDNKYSDLFRHGYGEANWQRLASGVLRVRDRYQSQLSEEPSLVDFGFGKGSAMGFFEKRGFRVEGVDISSYAVEEQKARRTVYHASLDNLKMIPTDYFTFGFSNDVIEHVLPDLVRPSLEEMARVCSDFLFLSIATRPSKKLSLDGENLHLTIKPLEWWHAQLKELGDVKKVWLGVHTGRRYCVELKPHAGNKGWYHYLGFS